MNDRTRKVNDRTRKDEERRDDVPDSGPRSEGTGSVGTTDERSSENRREGLEHDRERARERLGEED